MGKVFIHDDFLLETKAGRRLYHEFAVGEPIFDYHTHLPPADVARNRQFANIAEIWLEGDHYKWRGMRANGIEERLITGDAPPKEKFRAWAATVPQTLRNPLYHWTHLELKRYFDIDTLLSEETAEAIWEETEEKLASPELSAQGILKKFNVAMVGTTDDPTDDLAHHQTIAGLGISTKVLPTYRPDNALNVHRPELFNPWVEKLAASAGMEIANYADFVAALRKRHDFFHEQGCRVSDHGLDRAYGDFCLDAEAEAIFGAARLGKAADEAHYGMFVSNLMRLFGQWNAERGWVMQLHLGPLRNNSTRLMAKVGADAGCDSMGDVPQALGLSRFLDGLDVDDQLPRTVVYNLNPADNYVVAAMVANFQDGTLAGKLQYGSGWWFLDQKEGMEWQLNALSNLGLLSRFVGMLTDSRSFMSYPRHEYFRRVLCNLIGRDVEKGEIPDEDALVGPMIRNICYGNAARYFGV
ncbi:MAG: glucuronate isomerase [Verrucomicrobia bacterium]|nr:glucuronate isomerase [Verrucomicrobiota bacterium]